MVYKRGDLPVIQIYQKLEFYKTKLLGIFWQTILSEETPGPLPSVDPLYKELKFLDFNDINNFSIAKFIYLTLCEKTHYFIVGSNIPRRFIHMVTRASVIISCDDMMIWKRKFHVHPYYKARQSS